MHQSSLEIEDIWSIVKKIRFQSIKNLSLSSSNCYHYGFEHKAFLLKTTAELEKMLHINSSELVYQNVTEKTLEDAAQVFIYLSFCPGQELLSWKQFFQNLFQNFQAKMMLLNLNRILKNSDESILKITHSIMNKLTSMLKKQLVTGESTKSETLCKFMTLFRW